MNEIHDREEIDQVRKLLFGEIQRENQRRFAELEAQLDELRRQTEQQLSALSATNAASHQEFVRALGAVISNLGNQISQLAGNSTGDSASHE